MKSSSLKVNIWLYLVGFTFIIIFFLWFFQIVTINFFYEYSIEKEIKESSLLVSNTYLSNDNLDKDYLDLISYEQNVCIEIVRDNNIVYSSNLYNRGCIGSNEYKTAFYNQEKTTQTYRVTNEQLNIQNLVYATKMDDIYIFVNASLEPLGSTIYILSDLLILVSIIVIVCAFTIGFFISRRISRPIENLTNQTKLLAKGKYKFNFEGSTIKEINELSKTLNVAKLELEKNDSLRRDLLANVSHDLKTPLTMIKGYAEMIKDINYNDKDKMFKDLDIIIEESNRLNKLVEEILVMSKQESNMDKLNIEEFDITDLINKVLNRFDIFKEEGYKIEFLYDKKLLIKADSNKIEQVLYNLISNAINYTGVDKTVKINIIKDTKIEITDSGKGIKESELPYIWNKYYHSNKNHQRNKTGTGLGLFIVKTILENHNFDYGVISKKNKGSTFYFDIKEK